MSITNNFMFVFPATVLISSVRISSQHSDIQSFCILLIKVLISMFAYPTKVLLSSVRRQHSDMQSLCTSPIKVLISNVHMSGKSFDIKCSLIQSTL